METPAKLKKSASTLLKDGYMIAERLLSADALQKTRNVCETLSNQQSPEERKANRSLGSLINIWKDPAFTELATSKPILNHLADLGIEDLKFSGGYIFSKPPHSPATFWHQDWWCWDAPESYAELPMQIGLLCYLQDTHQTNGALRVIPGSHRRMHELHHEFAKRNKKELRAGNNESDLMFQNRDDQRTVEVKAGDVVIFDARLMHSAHPNSSDAARQLVTLWYFPFYSGLPERVRATIGTPSAPAAWPQESRDSLLQFQPNYSGSAQLYAPNEHPSASMFK